MTATLDRAQEILERFATNNPEHEVSWPGWADHHIDFKVGPATAELHSAFHAFRTIYSVNVHVDHRGRGHGRRLMDVIVAYAEATGCGLSLSVLVDNEPAVRLYRSVGFRITHTSEAGTDDLGRPRPAEHYMKRYPTRIPATPEWDTHFEAKALRLERDHEPRLGSDEGVAAMDALHAARKVAYKRDEGGNRARYTGSANYEENSRRLYCDAILAALRESGWTITRTNDKETT